jgi:hypothetical protein
MPRVPTTHTHRAALANVVRHRKGKRSNAEHAEKGKERGKHGRRTLLFPRLSNLFFRVFRVLLLIFWVLSFALKGSRDVGSVCGGVKAGSSV